MGVLDLAIQHEQKKAAEVPNLAIRHEQKRRRSGTSRMEGGPVRAEGMVMRCERPGGGVEGDHRLLSPDRQIRR